MKNIILLAILAMICIYFLTVCISAIAIIFSHIRNTHFKEKNKEYRNNLETEVDCAIRCKKAGVKELLQQKHSPEKEKSHRPMVTGRKRQLSPLQTAVLTAVVTAIIGTFVEKGIATIVSLVI